MSAVTAEVVVVPALLVSGATQWAAVRTCVGEMSEPPQMKLPLGRVTGQAGAGRDGHVMWRTCYQSRSGPVATKRTRQAPALKS